MIAYPGQTIYCPPGEEHWHGASPDSFMEHLAMLDNAEDPAGTTTWLEHVTDVDYLGQWPSRAGTASSSNRSGPRPS